MVVINEPASGWLKNAFARKSAPASVIISILSRSTTGGNQGVKVICSYNATNTLNTQTAISSLAKNRFCPGLAGSSINANKPADQ